MKQKRLVNWVACVLFVFFMPFSVHADDSPYIVAVTVHSQSEVERLPALRAAFAEVVNVVSHDNTMATKLNVGKVADIYPYIKRYYYEEADTEDDSDDSDSDDTAPTQMPPSNLQDLVVEFDPLAIDDLIKTGNVTVIPPSNLTRVLLWLEVDEGKKPWMLANDEEDKLAQQVKFMGKTKGLDIMLPMMDLDDLNQISTDDISQFNVSEISQASMRYGSDLVLAGAIKLDNKKWSAQWLLLKNGKRFTWSDTGYTLNGTILSGILKATDMINTPNAIEINKEERVVLTITNIGNVTNYASVNAYLQKLNTVSSLQVIRVEPTQVIFDVHLVNNNRAEFIKALQANPHLELESNPTPQELNFKWKGH